MKILAIDTSSKICSVSVLEDTTLLIEQHNNDEKTHSQKLMPLINDTLNAVNLELDDINLLACCQGPGSFTGIRIGISTIKAFADVKNIPVIGVTSLESLAYNVGEQSDFTGGLIASIIDAKHDNVYCALFEKNENDYTLIESELSCNIATAISFFKAHSNGTITFVGDGAVTHKNLILQEFSDTVVELDKFHNSACNAVFVSDELNQQTSVSVALSAYNKSTKSGYVPTYTISPIYLKKSEAEITLEKKLSSN